MRRRRRGRGGAAAEESSRGRGQGECRILRAGGKVRLPGGGRASEYQPDGSEEKEVGETAERGRTGKESCDEERKVTKKKVETNKMKKRKKG